ncbi:EAL domain-containing protein [Pradoshia sp.]
MEKLSKTTLLASIIFCICVFLISFSTLNKFTTNAVNETSEEQLSDVNKKSSELCKIRMENVLDNKLDIFTENLLESGAIERNKISTDVIIELTKYFKKENFIEIMGVKVDSEVIFVNENDEIISTDENKINGILSDRRNVFKYSIDGEDYLVIKKALGNYAEHDITTVYLHKDGSINTDLLIPVYMESSYAVVSDSEGNGIFYSNKDMSKVKLDNILDVLLTYSEGNSEVVNKVKIDMFNGKSGIIKYEGPRGKIWMSYSPIGFEDLYLGTVIPEYVIDETINEISNLNLISTTVIMIDIILIAGFFKLVEIFERKKYNKILNLDPVTNGNSYKKFNDELEKIYNKEIKAIYMAIDIDNFKIVNTVLGKECGDQVLKKIYNILAFHIENNGCYCRKEADNFLAFYKYKNYEEVEHIVNIICESIRHIILPQDHILIPSVGICYMNKKDISVENLEVNAIIAKKKSKNKINEFYSYFEDSNLYEMIDNKSILDDMNRALINKEFRLVYQPKFDAKTKKVVGAEALIRWTKPDNSTIFPNEFIPVAEKTGFITFIDSYVFKLLCEKQAEWMERGYDIVPISVNISREKLKDVSFIYEYLEIVRYCGIEKEYVQLEITEGDTYSYDNVKSNIVDIIKDAGFKVLIDDFGVGYSSLTMLKDIQADSLKLDRSFIMDDSSSGKSMLKHIIKIAKTFNYKIVAEGVETEEQYNLLKEDCDEIQGYYFSKPLEEEEFIDKYLRD